MNNELLKHIYDIATQEIGVTEESNPQRVEQYERATLIPNELISAEKTSWCAAFVSWVLEKAGLPNPKLSAAKSYLNWGEPIDKPIQGCVVVLFRNGGGHAAFFSHQSADGKVFYLLGGNQNNSVCVQAFNAGKVLGMRVPKEI